MKDEFAPLFKVTAKTKSKLFDDDGQPSLMAKLKRENLKRYDALLDHLAAEKVGALYEIKRRVDSLISVAKKAAKADQAEAARAARGDQDLSGFVMDANGKILPTQDNIRLAIERLGVSLRYDLFRCAPVVEGMAAQFKNTLGDASIYRLWLEVESRFGLSAPERRFYVVASDACRRNEFHPVLDYLDALRWDGTPRIDSWLIDYCGAADTPFNRAVSAKVLIAGVRRVRNPGCKFDTLLVLESPEGLNKSTMLEALAVHKDWFSDSVSLAMDDKRLIEATAGKWLIEIPELSGMSKREVEHVKAQLSRKTDRARGAYERLPVEVPRQFIATASTNQMGNYLASLTGHRRFWCVAVTRIDLERFCRDVAQLWAEANLREATGENTMLDESMWNVAAANAEEREVYNVYLDKLGPMIGDRCGKVFARDAWHVLGVADPRQGELERLGKAMAKLGFVKCKRAVGGFPVVAFVLPCHDGREPLIRWDYAPQEEQTELDIPEPKMSP